MTIASTGRRKLAGVRTLGHQLRAVVARFGRPDVLKGATRAEFEQVAQDLDISYPELCGLLTGRDVSSDLVEERLNRLDASTKRTPAPEARRLPAEMRCWLPIGPSCC